MKKLSLKDLKISSFVTKENIKVRGGGISDYTCEFNNTGCAYCPNDSQVSPCHPSEVDSACVNGMTQCVYY